MASSLLKHYIYLIFILAATRHTSYPKTNMNPALNKKFIGSVNPSRAFQKESRFSLRERILLKQCPVLKMHRFQVINYIDRPSNLLTSRRVYSQSRCTTKTKVGLIKRKWKKPSLKVSKHNLKQSLIGLIYMKPECPSNYIIQPFRINRYIKLRCFNKRRNVWKDTEAELNGRSLLIKLQGTLKCPLGTAAQVVREKFSYAYKCVWEEYHPFTKRNRGF